jgi:pectin methylesterase-like acyl-CoA thioesterase
MKQKLLLFIFGLYVGMMSLSAAGTPAVATWPCWTTVNATTATTSGQINALEELLAPGANLVYGSGKLTGTTAVQSVKYNGVWPIETGMNAARYIRFAIMPKTASSLNVDSVAMSIGAVSSSNIKAVIYYSTDSTFATGAIQLGTTYALSSSALTRVKFTGLNVNVQPGQGFYVRVYPWDAVTESSGKYISLLNVVIGGSTVFAPISSSIIWPCISDITSSVTTGTMMSGGATSLSNLTNYGSLSYGAISAKSIYTGSVWQAESAPAEGRYVQFAAAPKSGGTLVLDSVRMKLGGFATSDFRVSVYCSKDPAFTLSTGTKLGSDIVVPNNAMLKTTIQPGATTTVNSGEVLYLRLYPYHISTSGDQWKLVGLDSIAVFGKVTGITADPPTVTTTAVSYISNTFVSTGGSVSSDGGAAVTDRGIVYSTSNATPTISDTKVALGSGSGSFISQLSGLTAGAQYYARAYATNSAGTSYGNVIAFNTLAALTTPVLTTTAVSSILAVTAASGGAVTDWGGSAVTTRGICWSNSSGPTISNDYTTSGSDIGSFTCSLFALQPATTYYVRAFATNTSGTGYGPEISFTTQNTAPDVVKTVNKSGTGDYTTIQAAFNGVPDNYTGRWIINVTPGTYYEKCTLASTKSNVYLIGQDPITTIITYDAYAGQSNGAGGTWGTNNSFSVAIDASDFLAQNITFQNTIKNDGTHSGGEQAVALRTKGDRQQYYNCRLLGYQDTYYTNSNGRIYMKKCYIEGSVDFIFGNGVMILDSCTTFVNRNGGVVCAPNTDATSTFGYVFKNCTLSSLASGALGFDNVAMSAFYLGRPWQNNPKAVYLNCIEPATLSAAGWTVMTAGLSPYFAEYKCIGAGSGTTSRSTNVDYYGRQLTDAEALNYTISNIFAKTTSPSYSYNWMPSVYTAPTGGTTTAINGLSSSENAFRLDQNSPNPAVSSTMISYSIPTTGKVTLDVVNVAGIRVATLVNSVQQNGDYRITLNTVNLSKGIYFYTLKVGSFVQTKKMLVE